MSTVRDLLDPLVPRLRASESLATAVELMKSFSVRELPVVDEATRVIGIISESDVQPFRGHWEWTLVARAMTTDPLTVTPEVTVEDAARLLIQHGINSLPVTVDGRLVGMLRRNDLLRVVAAPAAGAPPPRGNRCGHPR